MVFFFFSYMSYSGCENVFKLNSELKWMTTERLIELELGRKFQETNSSKVPQGQPRLVVKKEKKVEQAEIFSMVPPTVLNEKVLHYLDFSFAVTGLEAIITRALMGSSLLNKGGVIYIGDLIQMNGESLSKKLFFGREAVAAIKKALAQKGLYLSTKLSEEWFQPTLDVPIEILNKRVVDYLGFNSPVVKNSISRNTLRLKHTMKTRIIELLRKNMIVYVGDLVQKSKEDLLKIMDLETVSTIETVLIQNGLNLAIQLSKRWRPPVMYTTQILNEKVIDYLDFSFVDYHTRNLIMLGLVANRIVYIGDLIQKKRENLIDANSTSSWQTGFFRNVRVLNKLSRRYSLGETKLLVLEAALAQRGLYLGTKISEKWIPPDGEYIIAKILHKKVVDYLDFNSLSIPGSGVIEKNYLENMNSRRITESLRANGIVYIGELIQRNREDLLEIYEINLIHLLVIESALEKKGLHLSTKLYERWKPLRFK